MVLSCIPYIVLAVVGFCEQLQLLVEILPEGVVMCAWRSRLVREPETV